MNNPEEIPIVFRNLLEKCVGDLHQGATVLKGRIKDDMGRGLPLSASSLAQEAQRVLDHVEKIRYTNDLYNVPPLPPTAAELCKRYIVLANQFQTEIVKRLADIAAPEEQTAEPQVGVIEKLRQKLEWFVPGEAIEVAEEIELGIGSIQEVAPELIPILEQIIEEANALLLEINKLA